MKKVAKKNEKMPVKPKRPEQSTSFHNQFKIFLTKAIPYICQKIDESKDLDLETKKKYKQIIQPFKNKIKKSDVYFLINKYDELSEQQFEKLQKICKESQQLMKDAKFDPKIRAFLQVQDFIEQNKNQNEEITFDCFTQATKSINQLNSFNRTYLFKFCESDYYPKIFSTKANKIDQIYVTNYIKFVLMNPKIME